MYKLTLVLLLAPFALFSLVVAISERLGVRDDIYDGIGWLYFPSLDDANASTCPETSTDFRSDDASIVAIPSTIFDEKYCNMFIQVQRYNVTTGEETSPVVTAMIVDQCDVSQSECGSGDIWLSPGAWEKIEPISDAPNQMTIIWDLHPEEE
ncbi:hypothetical protein BJV77DRAFT_1071937 [Russula vinacea]|nr:hypothetical protein BJV77DRAFT_1071937 [Russula vinacea]